MRLIESYGATDTQLLYGYLDENGQCLGVIGIECESETIEICHIAVDESVRKNGIAALLIDDVKKKHVHKEIVAQTDDDAVNFYKSLGFKIKSLGEIYKGYPRYLCTLKRDNETI